MAVGVLRVLGLNIPSQNMANPTDAKREKEALGRMTCTEFQVFRNGVFDKSPRLQHTNHPLLSV